MREMILACLMILMNGSMDAATAAPVRKSAPVIAEAPITVEVPLTADVAEESPTPVATPTPTPSPAPARASTPLQRKPLPKKTAPVKSLNRSNAPLASTTAATSYENYTKIPRERNSPMNTAPFKIPEGQTDWKEFWRNVHGSYGLSFMGPRIAGGGKETYNLYIPDVAPVQLAHAFQIGAQVNPDLQLGISQFAIQNVADGVVGTTGYVRGRTFEMYDPEIYALLPNLVSVDGFFVFTSVKMSIPTTEASKVRGKITQITIDQSWTTNTFGDWSFGLSGQLQPTFYTDPKPSFLRDRKTLYASIGHLISYRISPSVNIQSTSNFDFDHRSPDDQGPFHMTPNLDDYSRLSLYINPPVSNSVFFSIGGYFQFLVWRPGMETSILGMDFSISF